MNDRAERIRNILVPIISVVLGFVLGALLMLITGYNPIVGYNAMFSAAFQSTMSVGEILVGAAPLIFTALGFSVANSAGFFNIGLSGQALCGWVASVWVALSMPDSPKIVVVGLAIIAGALAGAAAAAIPGVLRAFFGTSEVIVTIMMNYVLLYVANHIVNNVMSEDIISNKGVTKIVGMNGTLRAPWLTQIFGGSRINLGIFLALIFLVVVWFLMKKTTLGFEIRSVGLNPFASEYAGMSSKRTIIVSMIISGLLAGLGGVVQGIGTFNNYFVQGASISIGFDGMAVSLLGNGSSIGILLSALLFSVLKLGGQGMQFAGIPSELANSVIPLIIFFVAINYVVRLGLAKVSGSKKQVEVVEEKSKPNEENQEGGEL
ncbi:MULTISPECIES: ABC transporter permease [Enterococcus]|uniref:ABC transporter permease n=1 Tax=Candidatus Enterococcus ferrettii TaxID=2815324 RepID=A0ABV0EJ58_9ENTE|nr:ABC transporter permease [Enterococcus sp. 665A]MBO1338366.1 ABC transporter permease [Enterococcus sp. 665A]